MSEGALAVEGQKYGNQFTQRQAVYFDKMSPLGKRNYGLHWLRKARAAYASQDYDTAMREVNMAIQFDPMSRDAISLRNEIVAAGGFEDESIKDYLHLGLPPRQRTRRDYSKDGYPWKEFEGIPDPVSEGVSDPGVPGAVRTIGRAEVETAVEPAIAPIVSPEQLPPAQLSP
jgi:hypothetical protein